MTESLIQMRDVTVDFSGNTAVDNFSLDLRAGERLAILGRTGAGKSTILSLLVGSTVPTSGHVRVLSHDPYAEHAALQGRVSMAFQAPNLMPWRTALGNVRIGLDILRRPRDERAASAQRWLERVHLGDAGKKYPNQLSGGMRQRVSLARAFAIEPEIVFLDESFSALDEVTAKALREDFVDLCEAAQAASVIVTHSIEEAFTIAHRVLVLARPARVIAEYDVREERARARSMDEIRAEIRNLMDEPDNVASTASVAGGGS